VNAPWWRLTADSRQTTNNSTARTIRTENVDDTADLLPPFYD